MFKQLLMISGFAKHYQIDKSFRNEDARSNRQIEFSQLDLEMSFTSTKKIMKFTEKFLKYVLKKTFDRQLKISFTVLTYQQVIEKYFGYFLQALEFAAPPHGGFGLGIDRLLAIILNLKSLKEVIAFPKNIDGSCSLTGTPNYFDE